MSYYLGLDVGGTKILGVVVDEQGNIVHECYEPTTQAGESALLQQLSVMAKRLQAATGYVQAAGVGMPAVVCPHQYSLSEMPNVGGLYDASFLPQLQKALGMPVVLENDVNAAALAEAWLGSAAEPLVFLSLGTGIGMGLMVNGRLCRGHRGAAGEVAMLPLGLAQPSPQQYQKALLEAALEGKRWLSDYRARGGVASKTLADCFARPDAIFEDLLREKSEVLALAILTIVAVLDPEAVCLGGSIGLQKALCDAVIAALNRYSQRPPYLYTTQLGSYAGALGAARAGMLMG